MGFHTIPEFDIEATKVGSNMPWGRVLRIELAVESEGDAENVPARVRCADGWLTANVIDSLGMERTAKSLEVAGNEDEIGMIDLEGGGAASGSISPTAAWAA